MSTFHQDPPDKHTKIMSPWQQLLGLLSRIYQLMRAHGGRQVQCLKPSVLGLDTELAQLRSNCVACTLPLASAPESANRWAWGTTEKPGVAGEPFRMASKVWFSEDQKAMSPYSRLNLGSSMESRLLGTADSAHVKSS